MRSPIAAMLWENWRLTRVEAAQRLGLGIVAGLSRNAHVRQRRDRCVLDPLMLSTPLLLCPLPSSMAAGSWTGTSPAFRSIFFTHVRSRRLSFVGVAMAYDAITNVAMYLRIRGLLMLVFGQPLPLLSVAVLHRGLPPCLHVHPMVDPKQGHSMDWIDRHQFAGLLSAQGTGGVAAARSSFRSPSTH